MYEPTPEEIKLKCREIQEGWNARQEFSRAGKPNRSWMAPIVNQMELTEAVQEFCSDVSLKKGGGS